jgi:AAA family ATP:ADP antiporter
MSKADICPRTDAMDLGSYKAWKKHDNLPLVKNEKIDISVVLDDNRIENYNWEFDLDVVNNYNDKKCFMLKSDKSPAEIGSDKFKKMFAKRIITVELKNTNFDIEVLNIRDGLKRVSLKNNIINVKAVIENVNKLVLHKIDKIPGTNVEEEHASQVLDRNSWVNKMGKLRFRVLGREPIISREHIKMHKVFIDGDKFCIFDGDIIEDTDIISERSCSVYGLDWTCKYDDPKKHKGWHCDLKISDNKNLAREVVKDLQVEFVLCKTYSSMNTNQNSKIKTTLLKRRLFKEKIKEESPLALFCTLFLFVSLFLSGYFAFLFYIGDVGNRAKMFTSVERTKMSPIRRFFFPIYMSELTKVLPLCFLMVCTVFVYSTYRDIKDSMVVGAADEFYLKAGNVMTNWLKMFGVLPCALIFMTVLMNLTQRYRFPTVFYGVTAFFGFYFVLNALVLYPNRKILTVMPIVNWMKELEPDSMLSTFGGGAAGIFAFPVTSLHYIMSELWGTVTLSFLAWGYTNIITKREDASRWYPQVALLAQIGQIIAGSSVGELATSYKENYNKCLLYLNCLTAVLTVLFGLTCFWLDQFVMQMPRFKLNSEGPTSKKKKEKVGLCAGIKYAINDGYVFCLSGIVFAYGAIMVCMELTYKDTYCSQFFWDKSKMTVFKGMETMLTGVLTLSAMMFIGSNLLNWFGWLFTALFTPVVAGIFCILFYIICSTTNIATYQLLFIDGRIAMKNAGSGSSLAWICAYLGMAMCVFIKSFKYATLDPTKEIAYLPLSKSEKSKAKAIVDIVGARAGKSAGALFNIFFTSIIGGGSALTTPMKIVSFIFSMVLLFLWVASAYSLDKHIQIREKNNTEKNEEIKSDLESGNLNQKSKLKADTRN